MRFLVTSDTHNYTDNIKNVIDNFKNEIDMIIHLGDHDDDAKMLSRKYTDIPFHYVKGNNDYGNSTPENKMLNFADKNIIITHGHKHNVYWTYDNISYWAEENGADAVLFGHTHNPINVHNGKLYIFNPGSISMPRGIKYPSFGFFDIDKSGNMSGEIMLYMGKNKFININEFK